MVKIPNKNNILNDITLQLWERRWDVKKGTNRDTNESMNYVSRKCIDTETDHEKNEQLKENASGAVNENGRY